MTCCCRPFVGFKYSCWDFVRSQTCKNEQDQFATFIENYAKINSLFIMVRGKGTVQREILVKADGCHS